MEISLLLAFISTILNLSGAIIYLVSEAINAKIGTFIGKTFLLSSLVGISLSVVIAVGSMLYEYTLLDR